MGSSVQNWPHKWFGCFAESQAETKLLPSFNDWVDPNWNPVDRDRIVTYLQGLKAVCVTSSAPTLPCNLCGHELHDLATWSWDGYWLWPNSSLALNVEFHSLQIPDEMARTIREIHHYELPNIDGNEIEKGTKVLRELSAILKTLSQSKDNA